MLELFSILFRLGQFFTIQCCLCVYRLGEEWGFPVHWEEGGEGLCCLCVGVFWVSDWGMPLFSSGIWRVVRERRVGRLMGTIWMGFAEGNGSECVC